VEINSRNKLIGTELCGIIALVFNLNRYKTSVQVIIQNSIAMRMEKKLQQNLSTEDICLMRYGIGSEKKSLLASVIEIDEFSEYHPVKLVCEIASEELEILENGLPVSLVIKKQDLLLYVLLKGTVFQKLLPNGYVVLSITNIQLFAKEEKNNISSFRKLENLSLLPAA